MPTPREVRAMTNVVIERIPDAKEIFYDLARNDAAVAAFVRHWQMGGFPSWEDALTVMAIYLARDRKRLVDQCVQLKMEQHVSVVVDRIEWPVAGSDDEFAAGQAWWNALPKRERRAALEAAGEEASVADAWRIYRRGKESTGR